MRKRGNKAGPERGANERGRSNGVSSGHANHRQVARALVGAECLTLRSRGHSTREIGPLVVRAVPDAVQAMGCNPERGPSEATVRKLLSEALGELQAGVAQTAEDMRAEADHRLRTAHAAAWRLHERAESEAVKLGALRVVVEAEHRRVKLHGLEQRQADTALADLVAGVLSRSVALGVSAPPPAALLPPERRLARAGVSEAAAVVDVETGGHGDLARAGATATPTGAKLEAELPTLEPHILHEAPVGG